MAEPEKQWELQATDPATGRQIFKRDLPAQPTPQSGTYDFKLAAEFEVRDDAGRVLLETSGTAAGEYWCGVFLWFVDGSEGTRVRLDTSDQDEDDILPVPDTPLKDGG